MRFSRVTFAAVLIAAIALAGGCTETKSGSLTVTVTMVNASENNIHILASGEEASPGNRLAPGQARVTRVIGVVYELRNLLLGEDIISEYVALNFYAVRNNVRMAANECDAEVTEEGVEDITVTYTETFDNNDNAVGRLGCGG